MTELTPRAVPTAKAVKYLGMSRAQFYKVIVGQMGLRPFELAGIKMYRVADLDKIVEDAAQKTYGNPIHSARQAR